MGPMEIHPGVPVVTVMAMPMVMMIGMAILRVSLRSNSRVQMRLSACNIPILTSCSAKLMLPEDPSGYSAEGLDSFDGSGRYVRMFR